MKKISLFIFLLFSFCFAQATVSYQFNGFKWTLDGANIFKINTDKFEISAEDLDGKIKLVGMLKTDKNVFKDLPKFFNSNFFVKKQLITFTISGTGQVYQLDTKTLEFRRLDNTYFRGYNFYANQFVRNDTIFSIGGHGFWTSQSLITFYNKSSKEWDIVNVKGNAPKFVWNEFSGYEKTSNRFFSAIINPDSVIKNIKIPFHIFDFKTHEWQFKGVLNDKINEFAKKEFGYLWTGKYILLYHTDYLIIDPFANKLFKQTNFSYFNKSAFNGVSLPHFGKEGYIYLRRPDDLTTTKKFALDSFSVDSLVLNSTYLGAAYEDESHSGYFIWVIVIVIILVFGISVFIFLRRKLEVDFTDEDKVLLNAFLQLEENQQLNVSEINKLLGIDNKSYDNQRKVRNKAISSLNHKLYKIFLVKEIIQKAPDLLDKRMTNYFVNQKIKSRKIAELLRKSI